MAANAHQIMHLHVRSKILSQSAWERQIAALESAADVDHWLYHNACCCFLDRADVGVTRIECALMSAHVGAAGIAIKAGLMLAWALWRRGQLPFARLVSLFSLAATVRGADITHLNHRTLTQLERDDVERHLREPRAILELIARQCQAAIRPWALSGQVLWAEFSDRWLGHIEPPEDNSVTHSCSDGSILPDTGIWAEQTETQRLAMIATALSDPLTVLSIDGTCTSVGIDDIGQPAPWFATLPVGRLGRRDRRILQIAVTLKEQRRFSETAVERLICALVTEDRANMLFASPHRARRSDAQVTDRIRANSPNEPPRFVVEDTLRLLQQEHQRFPRNAEINRPIAALMDIGDWLSANSVDHSKLFSLRASDHALALGALDDNHALFFTGDQSLVTIAPPGAGKTRGFVFPNLLSFRGSVLVLDVKGECYAATAEHRRQFSDVYLFAPEEPGQTGHRFNPLQFLSRDPMAMTDDARVLAGVIVQPSAGEARFFDERARDLLVSILVLLLDRERRTGAIPTLAAIHQTSRIAGEELAAVLEEMAASTIPALQERATELIAMIGGLGGKAEESAQRTVLNVFETLRQHLSVFEGDRVRNITSGPSSWSPAAMRERPTTIYLRVSPAAMKSLAPLLRVVIACHLQQLMPAGSAAAAQGRVPVLAIFDELPQLGAMEQIEAAVHVGRSYGLRSWLFAQHVGQLEDAYGQERSRALLNACAVQIWMNPIAEDAARLSDLLGFVDDDAATPVKRLATARALSGPEFRDVAIIKAIGEKPALVRKGMS